MPSALVFLNEERNKTVRMYMAIMNIKTKGAAIEDMIDRLDISQFEIYKRGEDDGLV
jgi:hypothetical protein